MTTAQVVFYAGLLVGAILTIGAIVWTVQYRRFERVIGCEPPNLFGWGDAFANTEAAGRARRLLRETREKITAKRSGRPTNDMECLDYLQGLEQTIIKLMKFWSIEVEVKK